MNVIRFDYDKHAAHPVTDYNSAFGYDYRPIDPATGLWIPPSGIILHSTEHALGQSFRACAEFLRDSELVSAHYQVGMDGEIQRILDPMYRAWHAGLSRWNGRTNCNDWTVGIEVYHTEQGPDYTPEQLTALAWLCRQLMADHPTITHPNIACHRWVALPLGRKRDPTSRTDSWWSAWIAAL